MDDYNVLVAGVVCLAGAIVGGSFKIFGIELPMLNSKPRQILLGLLGMALISPSAVSKIDTFKDGQRCDNYAEQAVKQFDENIQRSCGFKGARWHDSFPGHHEWCISQTPSSTQSENTVRERDLETCVSKAEKLSNKLKIKS